MDARLRTLGNRIFDKASIATPVPIASVPNRYVDVVLMPNTLSKKYNSEYCTVAPAVNVKKPYMNQE